MIFARPDHSSLHPGPDFPRFNPPTDNLFFVLHAPSHETIPCVCFTFFCPSSSFPPLFQLFFVLTLFGRAFLRFPSSFYLFSVCPEQLCSKVLCTFLFFLASPPEQPPEPSAHSSHLLTTFFFFFLHSPSYPYTYFPCSLPALVFFPTPRLVIPGAATFLPSTASSFRRISIFFF